MKRLKLSFGSVCLWLSLCLFPATKLQAQSSPSVNGCECCCEEAASTPTGDTGDCFGGEPVAQIDGSEKVLRGSQTPLALHAFPQGGMTIWDNGSTDDTVWVNGGTHIVFYQTDLGCEVSDTFSVLEIDAVLLMAMVMLQGPFDPQNGLMQADLQQAGLLPPQEPFTAMGFHVTQGSGLVLPPQILGDSGAGAPIDWLLLELRDPLDPEMVLAAQPVVLHADGQVTGVDGQAVLFEGFLPDLFHVGIQHRNHLGIMTAQPLPLGLNPFNMDFSVQMLVPQTFGIEAQVPLPGGTMAMWAGDADGSGAIDAGDRSATWNFRNAVGYLPADVNLDGVVNAADRSQTWNNRNIQTQLP